MITLSTIQEILAEMFFDNNTTIAGLIIYVIFLTIAFAICKNIMAVMLISIPITLIFASMGVLTGDILIIMIIITVVGLAMAAGKAISGRD